MTSNTYTNLSKKIGQVLAQVKATSSRNDKTKFLSEFIKTLNPLEFNHFKTLCIHVFDYQYVFNVKKIPDYTWTNQLLPGTNTVSLNDLFSTSGLFSRLSKREITGHAARDVLNATLETTDCIETSKLIECVLDKSFDVGCDLNTFTRAFFIAEHGEIDPMNPKLKLDKRMDAIGYYIVHEHKVSLCEPGSQKLVDNFNYPAYGQLKYDAMRIELDTTSTRVALITRPGKTFFTNNDELDNDITGLVKKVKAVYAKYGYITAGNRIHFDGEMVFLTDEGKFHTRQASNGIGNKVAQGTKERIETKEIKFCVWDIITPEEKTGKLTIPYSVRFKILEELVGDLYCFKLAETVVVNSGKEAIELAIKYIKLGFEGCIIKNCDSPWIAKRGKHQIKLKAARECEMRIKRVNLAEDNKYHGLVGSLYCETDDKLVTCNISGMKDEERQEFLDPKYIGMIVTVLFNELITNKEDSKKFSLFLPRMVELRYDKTKTDTLKQILEAEFVVTA